MPQFVLLHHECPSGLARATHWDLMLEEYGVLRTWIVEDIESLRAKTPISVEEIQPHRLDYLQIEGPLSGDRGSVTRVDRGPMEILDATDLRIAARLCGQFLRGTLELTRASRTMRHWQLRFLEPDCATR